MKALFPSIVLFSTASGMDDTHLCDVITMHRPSARTRDSASHNSLLATGSMPVVGSSKNTTGGSPTNDMAVLNFRLFPPLKRRGLNNTTQ